MNPAPARILVVDDEKLIRWSVTERLQRNGYDVVSAESGEQALELVAAQPPDLMLLDVRLPGIDGVQTLQRALSVHPELAVLMMSAHSTVDIAVEAMKRGALDFLVKPFPFQALDAAVERAIATARTRRQITTQTSEDVIVKLHEAKPNSITYGGGFEVINRGGSLPSGTVAVPGIPPVGLSKDFKTSEKTFWGPRGHVEYTRRNVRGKAETITLSAIAGRRCTRN